MYRFARDIRENRMSSKGASIYRLVIQYTELIIEQSRIGRRTVYRAVYSRVKVKRSSWVGFPIFGLFSSLLRSLSRSTLYTRGFDPASCMASCVPSALRIYMVARTRDANASLLFQSFSRLAESRNTQGFTYFGKTIRLERIEWQQSH